MISYFRTFEIGAKTAISIFGDIPVMVLKSIRTHWEFHHYTEADRIIYDLEPEEMRIQTQITDATHLVVIPTHYYPDAEIKAALRKLIIPWIHVEGKNILWGQYYDSYAYQNQSGDILFQLPGFKRQMKFDRSLISE